MMRAFVVFEHGELTLCMLRKSKAKTDEIDGFAPKPCPNISSGLSQSQLAIAVAPIYLMQTGCAWLQLRSSASAITNSPELGTRSLWLTLNVGFPSLQYLREHQNPRLRYVLVAYPFLDTPCVLFAEFAKDDFSAAKHGSRLPILPLPEAGNGSIITGFQVACNPSRVSASVAWGTLHQGLPGAGILNTMGM